ncbi:UvrB/UvrC motif-containing protein [Candidatus Aerophobetes bacterium]|nr:UvrB/UvrC motif-containing protein [Candidatus Aerophobetes bacterium]
MLCQLCGQREATVHFKEVINGVTRELHLCEVCAEKEGFLSKSFPLPDFSLPSLITGLTEFDTVLPKKEKKCPGCGLSYTQIEKKGKMGCSLCYQTFEEYISPLLEKIHGRVLHRGKVPRRGKMRSKIERQLYQLRQELDKAVKKEEYERAAKLRDKIKKLQKDENFPTTN